MRDKFPEVSWKLFILAGICMLLPTHVGLTVLNVLNVLESTKYYVFQVIINFPDPAQKSDIVQFRGPRTEVEKCSKFMQKIVAEMVNNAFFN